MKTKVIGLALMLSLATMLGACEGGSEPAATTSPAETTGGEPADTGAATPAATGSPEATATAAPTSTP
ncbi:MAG: hypothetical protein RLZZ203_1611 [Cyanobacteriota bacterium]